MTSPLADDGAFYTDGVARTAPRRRRSDRQGMVVLALARIKRGVRRQALTTFAIAALVIAFGLWAEGSGPSAVPLRTVLVWIGAGLGAGLLVALMRELSRNTITSVSSLGRHRGYVVLGAAPELDARALRQLSPDQRSPLGCLAYQPASPFATAFRDLQGNLSAEKVVSFIGSLPGEGATTSAICTAASAAQQGRSVVVVDCDIRRRSLTRGFGLDPDLGVLEACERPEFWRDYVEEEGETGLHFLPAARPSTPWRSLISEAGFPALLNELKSAYDLVLLDCPPAHGSAEGPMIARLAERCAVVAVWDQTPLGAIRSTMRRLRTRPAATSIYVNRVPHGYRFGRLRPD